MKGDFIQYLILDATVNFKWNVWNKTHVFPYLQSKNTNIFFLI